MEKKNFIQPFFSLFFAVLLLSCCSLFDKNADEETVSVLLPDWPPPALMGTNPGKNYPKLSRWKITITGKEGNKSFYSDTERELHITVSKNCPFCILALPINLLNDGAECVYFYPAGFIYPQSDGANFSASWEQGYTAHIMAALYNNCKENGLSPAQAAGFISTINWTKMKETIEEKIRKSEDLQAKYYNPWLCDSAQIVRNLSDETFRVSLINPAGLYQLSAASLYESTGVTFFSPFIPENQIMAATGKISVKKDSPLLLSNLQEFAIFVTYLNAKNVKIEYIYMPIYKEEYEES